MFPIKTKTHTHGDLTVWTSIETYSWHDVLNYDRELKKLKLPHAYEIRRLIHQQFPFHMLGIYDAKIWTLTRSSCSYQVAYHVSSAPNWIPKSQPWPKGFYAHLFMLNCPNL